MSAWDEVVALALARETAWPRDLRAVIEGGTFDPPPWNVVKGPVRPRGGPAGMVVRGGRTLASWGDVARADMTFSVTKSWLAIVMGLAVDEGLDPDRAVGATVDHPAFRGPRNGRVTWLQLLQQTSEWEGTLWGIPDEVDRNRQLSPDEDRSRLGRPHVLREPGTFWDYNDVRVNALCLALTLHFGRPLGEVLAERVLRPLAAPPGLEWWGYPEARVDGVPVVVGGGHWGGGIVASAAHLALLGRIALEHGAGVVSPAWTLRMLSPCALNPLYGCLWWLNTDRRLYAAASEGAVFALGVGLNAVWVEPEHDLVVAATWLDEPAFPALIDAVLDTLRS